RPDEGTGCFTSTDDAASVRARGGRPGSGPVPASAAGSRRHTRSMNFTAERATALLALHADPALLKVVNVWDVASARVVAATAGTAALATASHAIAASYGYEDGEHIPRDLMLETVGRIAADVDLPVTADLA